MTTQERVYFTLRVDAELREKLNRLAADDYRSASNLAELLLRRGVETLEALRGDPSPGHSVKA